MRMKFYYGWYIVIGSALCQFVCMATSQVTVGVLMTPVIEELGWKVWQFTFGLSVSLLGGAISSVIVGKIIDSRGPKILVLLGALTSTLCFVALGTQSNIFAFITLYSIGGLIGWSLFGPMVVNVTLSKWFIEKRGWTISLGSMGSSSAFVITPFLFTLIVDSWGWRNGYFLLAFLVAVIVIPTSLLMRRQPEDYGLIPDGKNKECQTKKYHETVPEINLTREQALRTYPFWAITIGFALITGGLMGIFVHGLPFAEESGFSRKIGATALSINGIGNLFAKPVWGYFLQRINTLKIVLAAYSLTSIAVMLILLSGQENNGVLLLIAFLLFGIGFSATVPLNEFITAEYFGRAHLGAIRGASYPLTTIGTLIGPILTGYWFDVSATYVPAFLSIIVVFIVAMGITYSARKPEKIIST